VDTTLLILSYTRLDLTLLVKLVSFYPSTVLHFILTQQWKEIAKWNF